MASSISGMRQSRAVKLFITALSAYLFYTGASGRTLLWKTGPHVLHRFATADAGRWAILGAGLVVVLLAWGPAAWANVRPARTGPYEATGELTQMVGQMMAELEHLNRSGIGRSQAFSSDLFDATFSYEEGRLVVGSANRNQTIENGTLNLLVPATLGAIRRINPDGVETRSGHQLTTSESLDQTATPSIYWAESGLRFQRNLSQLMYFALGSRTPGSYPISFRLVADPIPDRLEIRGSFVIPALPSSLVITSAKYGVPGLEEDVKDRLTELIDDGVLDFEVTLAYLLVDPAPGQFKTLRIRWTDNGVPDASAYREGTHVVIPRSAARPQ